MSRAPRAWFPFALVVAVLLAPAPARAEPPKTLEELHAAEVKALVPLLRAAMKEDFRRQMFAIAVRIRAVDPEHVEAANVVKASVPSGRQDGREPTKTFVQRRDQVLGTLAKAYAALAKATAAGGKAADAVPLLERALSYDDGLTEAHQQLEAAGRRFGGAWGSAEKAAFEAAFTDVANAVSFPSEMDDGPLPIRMAWPEAKVARWRGWRLHTTLPLAEVGPLMLALAAQETSFVATFGSQARPTKEEDEPTDLVLVPDATVFGKLVDVFAWDKTRGGKAKELGVSYDAWSRRLFVSTPPADQPWLPTQARLLGQASRVLVRRHIGAGAGGWLAGRGTWILEGVVGAYEGFVPAGADGGDVDPAKCWRLHAAKALHAEDRWIPWVEALELDRDAADRVPKADLKGRKIAGVEREVWEVSPLFAQATALVLGLWKGDPVKGPKRLAVLLGETYKRDRLPDLDKAMGLGAGKALEAATKALDLLPGG